MKREAKRAGNARVPVKVQPFWYNIRTIPVRLSGRFSQRAQLVQKKAAIYCRVSTADQSCERQELDLRAYAEKAGWHVVGVWKETASGIKNNRKERREILALAQARKLDIVLVTELTRWGRSTIDLIHTLQDLHSWNVSLIAQSGLQFDLGTSQGKLIAGVMASLSEFERDLIKERVKSGMAAAQARGKKIGRQPGQRFKSDKLAPKVLSMVDAGNSYRTIAANLKISKTTVTDIVKRHKSLTPTVPAPLTPPTEKTTTVELWLRVENNNKFVRGKKRARADIERYVLNYYRMKRLSHCEYELTFSYTDDQDLDQQIHQMLVEAESHADSRHCFTESDVREIGTDRSW